MKLSHYAAFGVLLAALLVVNCGEESTPAAPDPTPQPIEVWSGILVDPNLQAVLTTYQGTTYDYSLYEDMTFTVQANVGFGWGTVEKGTYEITDNGIDFTPTEDFVNDPATHAMVPAPKLREPYSAVKTDAETMTISSFLNVDDWRDLGTLTLVKI
jgi:hypothetical protein